MICKHIFYITFLNEHELFRLIGFLGSSVRQWFGRPGFNPMSRHTKDFKDGT